jgi:hypothetical protein
LFAPEIIHSASIFQSHIVPVPRTEPRARQLPDRRRECGACSLRSTRCARCSLIHMLRPLRDFCLVLGDPPLVIGQPIQRRTITTSDFGSDHYAIAAETLPVRVVSSVEVSTPAVSTMPTSTRLIDNHRRALRLARRSIADINPRIYRPTRREQKVDQSYDPATSCARQTAELRWTFTLSH